MMSRSVLLCLLSCGAAAVDAKTLFVIAGQSNAEGNVLLPGLQKLIAALPPKSEDGITLSAPDRNTARQAVAESQGTMCKSEVSTVVTADKTIDELRASKIDWRSFTESYQHPTVKVLAAHYSHTKVTLHEKQNATSMAKVDGILNSEYCSNLCSTWINSPGNTHGAAGCLNAVCGSNQFLSCSQACVAKRQGASESKCLSICTGPRSCEFEFDTQIFAACAGCGDCKVPSTQGCQYACTHATDTSGLAEDPIPGKLVDNKGCSAKQSETVRFGPQLNRYSGTTFQPLAAGFGADNKDVTFGMELSFGAGIAGKVPEAMLLKVAMGGSSLGDHWRTDGPFYSMLIRETKDAIQKNQASLGGFVWFQGFNDQFKDVWCQPLHTDYESRLRSFLQKFRADTGVDIPVVIVKARTCCGLAPIQQAQEAVAASLAHVSVIPSADLSDCFHYDSGSQIIIGERAAASMLKLLEARGPLPTSQPQAADNSSAATRISTTVFMAPQKTLSSNTRSDKQFARSLLSFILCISFLNLLR